MKRMQFVYLADGVAVRATHLEHHRTLVGTLREAISQQGEPQLSGLEQPFEQWAIDELMKFGVVSLYHLWERQAKSLLFEQLEMQTLPERKGHARNDAAWYLLLLKNQLSADASEKARLAIDECRLLANAIKHDTGDKYEELEQSHPAHFVVDGGRAAMDRFRVTWQSLDNLFDELIEFWDTLPRDIDHRAGR